MRAATSGKEGLAVADISRLEDPGALSGVLTGVSFIGGLATGLSLADAPFPRPGADVKDIQRFFLGNAGPERINLTGQLLSAASLAMFSVSVARLAGRASQGSKALRAAAIAGGALASVSLAASATAAAALTAGPGRDEDRARSLHRFLFAAGGPVHGAGLALLLGALGLAGRRTGALPRPLATAALASAGVDALAPVVLAAPKAALVIPTGRFPTFVVLGITGSAWLAAPRAAEMPRAGRVDHPVGRGDQPQHQGVGRVGDGHGHRHTRVERHRVTGQRRQVQVEPVGVAGPKSCSRTS
jgi:hypothetical protein